MIVPPRGGTEEVGKEAQMEKMGGWDEEVSRLTRVGICNSIESDDLADRRHSSALRKAKVSTSLHTSTPVLRRYRKAVV